MVTSRRKIKVYSTTNYSRSPPQSRILLYPPVTFFARQSTQTFSGSSLRLSPDHISPMYHYVEQQWSLKCRNVVRILWVVRGLHSGGRHRVGNSGWGWWWGGDAFAEVNSASTSADSASMECDEEGAAEMSWHGRLPGTKTRNRSELNWWK